MKKALIILAVLLASFATIYNYSGSLSWNPYSEVVFSNIFTAKTDSFGDTYVVDNGRARIIKRSAQGYADYIIEGGGNDTPFFSVCDISVENEDYFYVHDVIWDATGMKMEAERILEFSKKNGVAGRVLYVADRTKDEELAPGLSSMQALDGLIYSDEKIWFVKKTINSYIVISLAVKVDKIARKGETPESMIEYVGKYNDAIKKIFDFSIDPVKRSIYYTDKSGNIFHSTSDDVHAIFVPVSGNRASEFSLPFQISCDGASLYFTDIGKRAVLCVDDAGQARKVMGGWGDIDSLWPVVYNSVYAARGLLTLTSLESVVIADMADGIEKFNISTLPVGDAIVAFRTALTVVFVIFIVSTLIVLKIAFSYLYIRKLSQKEWFGFVIILVTSLVFFSITPSILGALRSDMRSETLNRLSYMMQVSPKILDSESFAAIKTPQDYDSPAYQKFTQSLNNLVDREYEWNENKYCVAYKFQDDILYVTAFLDGSIGAFSLPDKFEGSDAHKISKDGAWITNIGQQDVSGTYISLTGPIFDKRGNEVIGILEMGVELGPFEEMIYRQFRTMIVRTLLIISIMLFLLSEILESLPLTSLKDPIADERRRGLFLPVSCISPITFAIFLIFNLSSGFAPNYAATMGGSLWNLSYEFSSVLPLTAGHVMLAVGPLLCAKLIVWIGIKRSFVIGALFGVLGEAMNASATSIYTLFWGMSATGLCAGFLFTVIHVYVASLKHPDDRAVGFSMFTVASFTGINCGIMVGGAVAVYFNQSAVYYMGSFLWLLALAAFMFITKKEKRGTSDAEERHVPSAHPSSKIAFVRRSPLAILGFLFLLLFPYSILSGFLYYLVPIFGDGNGLSESEISLVFVLYGVGAMFGPKLASIVKDANPSNLARLLVPVLSGLAAVLCFAILQSTGAMLVAVFIMGCSNSAGGTCFPLYFTEMSATKSAGAGTEMVIYNFIESLGYAGGPLVFGILLNAQNIIAAFSILIASIALTFSIFCWGQTRQKA
ncbi:MAG: MFS transporter [Synergistaceae bacterium]|jgi:predicted MFS family arabinose efflux permease|nr:MFS transporter [Synergistaceae bacterium]